MSNSIVRQGTIPAAVYGLVLVEFVYFADSYYFWLDSDLVIRS